MFSGDSDTRDKPKPRLPDWMSVAHYLRAKEGGRANPLPNYIGVPAASLSIRALRILEMRMRLSQ